MLVNRAVRQIAVVIRAPLPAVIQVTPHPAVIQVAPLQAVIPVAPLQAVIPVVLPQVKTRRQQQRRVSQIAQG